MQIPFVPVFWGSSVFGGIGGKQMTPQLWNEAFLAENKIKKVFRVAMNHNVPTYISESKCVWWKKTNRQTHIHRTATVTLAARARRRLIIVRP